MVRIHSHDGTGAILTKGIFVKFVRVLVAVLSVVSLISCSSTTMIRSSDPDAKIYVDGEFKGTGMATHTDQKTVGSTTSVRIEKDNCEPQFYTFSRSEEFDVGACIGGALVLVPFLWIQKYKSERTYDFTCRKRK